MNCHFEFAIQMQSIKDNDLLKTFYEIYYKKLSAHSTSIIPTPLLIPFSLKASIVK